MKVLGIGESVIDQTHTFTEGILESGVENVASPKLPLISVGGPVLTAMILLARLGIACTFISTVGRDTNADIIKNLLRHEKVSLLPKYQKHTKVNKILVDKQTGFRKKLRGEITHQPLHGIDKKFLQQFDAVIFDRHETLAFYETLDKKNQKTKLIIDPSIEVSKFTLDMVRYADYPIVPIEFVTKFETKLEKGLEKLYALCHKPIIVTAGELGSIVYDGSQISVIPAKNIKAIDATGAGDIYRGGFTFGVLQGWETQASVTFANLVAGLQCTKRGNASAIPTNAEILLHACKTETKTSVTLPMMNAYFNTLV